MLKFDTFLGCITAVLLGLVPVVIFLKWRERQALKKLQEVQRLLGGSMCLESELGLLSQIQVDAKFQERQVMCVMAFQFHMGFSPRAELYLRLKRRSPFGGYQNLHGRDYLLREDWLIYHIYKIDPPVIIVLLREMLAVAVELEETSRQEEEKRRQYETEQQKKQEEAEEGYKLE
jgi:hypothetical protein